MGVEVLAIVLGEDVEDDYANQAFGKDAWARALGPRDLTGGTLARLGATLADRPRKPAGMRPATTYALRRLEDPQRHGGRRRACRGPDRLPAPRHRAHAGDALPHGQQTPPAQWGGHGGPGGAPLPLAARVALPAPALGRAARTAATRARPPPRGPGLFLARSPAPPAPPAHHSSSSERPPARHAPARPRDPGPGTWPTRRARRPRQTRRPRPAAAAARRPAPAARFSPIKLQRAVVGFWKTRPPGAAGAVVVRYGVSP